MVEGINILFGSACNMRCGYCLQISEKAPADHKADPELFVEKLSGVLKQAPATIAYWGGEPMLYWGMIKAVHSGLSRKGIVPTHHSVITTNGRLLTDEYVDYANAHPDIWTVVSLHDGGFTDEQMDRIFRLERFSLSELVHAKRTSLWDLQDLYYRLKLRYGRAPKICVHFLRCNDGCSPDYYMRREDVDSFCRHLMDIVRMARMGDEWASWQCRQLLFRRDRVRARSTGALCVRDGVLSVDLHGNTYACHHNFSAKNMTGNLFRIGSARRLPIVSGKTVDPQRFAKSQKCRDCEFFNECRGGCYTSNTHELDCYLQKNLSRIYRVMEAQLWN